MRTFLQTARRSAGLAALTLLAASGCGDSTPKTTAVREVDSQAVRQDQSQMENFMKTKGKAAPSMGNMSTPSR